MSDYIKGSEWRRWDLHIHTPGTMKYDHFAGATCEEKWDKYYTNISDYVGDGTDPTKSIAVIGITDYLSIDNYRKVVSDNRLPKSIELVLPNVEMRIQPMAADSPLNIHFIFDPRIVDSLESRFFCKLKFPYGDTTFSAARDELVRLGKKLNDKADDSAAYKLGISQFVPSLDSIKEVFEDLDLKSSTVIAVSNGNSDGASGITFLSSYCEIQGEPSQLTLFRQSVYRFSDIIFSAKPCDIAYFLGEKSDKPEVVINKCGSLKPCVHGSDAHTNSKIFEPDDKKYCWVKADPTFNGLRQIIYEPKERVRISTIKPETKADYHVIDHVEINDPGFQKIPIYFNDQLNCIIGGKSTGKSILLHNLALTIDKKQVDEKLKITNTSTKILPNIKTYWLDGAVSTTQIVDNEHKIVYIPQTYLNRLSDDKNEEVTEIDDIIQDIVLLDDKAREAYDTVEKAIKEFKPNLAKQIFDLVQIHGEIVKISNDKKELGTNSGILKEIEKLKLQREALSKELSLSEDDIKNYDDAVKRMQKAQQALEVIQKEIEYITALDTIVEAKTLALEFSTDTLVLIERAKTEALDAAVTSWRLSKENILKALNEKKNKTIQDSTESSKIEQELHDKIVGNEAIGKLNKSIQEEEAKLQNYNKLDVQEKSKVEILTRLLDSVVASVDSFYSWHTQYAEAINNNPDLKCSDLEFSVNIRFRSVAYCTTVKSIFDNRILKSRKDIIDIDKPEDCTLTNIRKLVMACLNSELPLVKNNTLETALRNIMDDWYNTTYSVKMDNDPIGLMSPGKKALVLLKLLINLAESKCPILIDQPEDDLDNRSVFDDLIPFIKEKKKERQIIVVTHNANVVLGGDAEEIIVANQNGNNAGNKEFRFEYRSGSIEDDLPVYDANGNVMNGILNKQGIQQHICDILEGGEKAFDLRKNKYHI